MISHEIDEHCPYVALKTKVTQSQRARDKPHEPWVYLEKATVADCCADCICMAGYGFKNIFKVNCLSNLYFASNIEKFLKT